MKNDNASERAAAPALSRASVGLGDGYLQTERSYAAALAALQQRTKPLAAVSADRFEITPETGADTSFIVESGVPGFGLVPDPLHYFDDHHTPADTLDKIDPKELAQDSAAIAALAWIVAN